MKAQIFGIVFIIILLVGLGTLIAMRGDSDSRTVVAGESEKFVGTIESYDTGCLADGICSVTIDGKVVVTTIGFRQEVELGKLVGVDSLSDFETRIGDKAEVYALKQEDGTYTLYGDSEYYVKVESSNNATSTTPFACTMDAKICPDGTAVGRTGPNCEFEACPEPADPGGCFVVGCSGQVCSDTEDLTTTCEWKEEYACYKEANAKCERQASGKCGWTPSNDLTMCLNAAR